MLRVPVQCLRLPEYLGNDAAERLRYAGLGALVCSKHFLRRQYRLKIHKANIASYGDMWSAKSLSFRLRHLPACCSMTNKMRSTLSMCIGTCKTKDSRFVAAACFRTTKIAPRKASNTSCQKDGSSCDLAKPDAVLHCNEMFFVTLIDTVLMFRSSEAFN